MQEDYFYPPAPTPKAQPPNTWQLVKAILRNPLEIWAEQDFALPIQTRATILGKRVLVNSPEGVRHVFLDNAVNYHKNALQLRLLKPALGEGLITANGEQWRRQRRVLTPLFSAKQMQVYIKAQHQVVGQTIARLQTKPVGSVIDISLVMGELTLEVLEHTLFTQGFGVQAGVFQQAVTQYFATYGKLDVADLLGLPDYFPRLRTLHGKKVLRFLDKTVSQIMAARQALINAQAAVPQDMLTLLLTAKDEETGELFNQTEVRDNIITFIGAGHETTANALTWAIYLLSQSPAWRAKVEHEIDTQFKPEDPQGSLPITKAVLEETMRLYPPVWLMSRVALADDVINGQAIKAGTVVLVSPYVLHRNEAFWHNPTAFNPSRFLADQRQKINKYAYLPFATGPRMCIGMSFALNEMLIVLAKLLAVYQFDLKENFVVKPKGNITLRPENGMPMVMRKRA
jgi:cytochrome P450